MTRLLDIFSGCGGLSLGAHQAGMSTAVAIDADPILSSSFKTNFPKAKLVRQDVRSLDRDSLDELIPNRVDGVVGGPPCQAFSAMGRRAPEDPRRDLLLEYFRIVSLVMPKFFLFENVKGLGFPQNIGLLERGIASLSGSWTILGPVTLNAAHFGAPTNRHRLFVIGFNNDLVAAPSVADICSPTLLRTNVAQAIGDLAGATKLRVDEKGFDFWKYDGRRKVSEYALERRNKVGVFTTHTETEHTRSTLKRFSKLEPGQTDKIGKYRRLEWEGLCPTLRAGTGNDRGSYQAVRPIHPTEHRVITPREAARLQGFPDAFVFHPTVWHSCRMIGNSVSPVIAKVLLQRIGKAMKNAASAGHLMAAE